MQMGWNMGPIKGTLRTPAVHQIQAIWDPWLGRAVERAKGVGGPPRVASAK
jgi:hypothetical protein